MPRSASPSCSAIVADGLILVTSWPGQRRVEQLEREALEGLRPRTDYVEVARRLGADVMDANYMAARSTRSARIAAQLGGLAQGQIVEALLREQRYRWVLAWADHLGFRLAAASKLLRRHVKLIIVSVRLATSKKRFLLGLACPPHPHRCDRQLRLCSTRSCCHSRCSTRQASSALPAGDERFWKPAEGSEPDLVCAVGWEARDYETLVTAVDGLPCAWRSRWEVLSSATRAGALEALFRRAAAV